MAKESFPRHRQSGFINLEGYLPYLPDPPDRVPINPPTGDDSPWVRQHLYFKWLEWRKIGLPEDESTVDPRMYLFRAHWTNQLIMRRNKERKVHRDHEEHIEPPPTIVVAMGLDELKQLDVVGAATLGKQIALDPERQRVVLPKIGPPKYGQHWSHIDRADFFDERREFAMNNLADAKVTHEQVITSALKRVSVMLDDGELREMADERLAETRRYYPLHTPTFENLYTLSNIMLKQACEIEEVELSEINVA